MLELKNIHWALPSGEEILKGIDINIPSEKLTIITGPNGGGKTSLAKLIAGLYESTEGQILFNGQDITKLNITERSRLGISFAFQQPVKFKGLTVRDLLNISAEETLSENAICKYLSEVGLCARDYINRNVDDSLSGGESKRIEIATVLARKDAKLLIFDEPEAGIDLWSFTSLIEAFKKIKEQLNKSLMIISHQERIMQIADYIIVVANGKILSHGPKDEILPTLLTNERQIGCPLNNVTIKE